MTQRLGKTDDGRTDITTTGEIPIIARSTKRYYQLWKLAEKLKPEEIEFLVIKRKNALKYEKDKEEIKCLRTEIKLLGDIYRIVNRRR